MGINVAQLIRHWAMFEPTRVALTLRDGDARHEVSYGELDARARRAASAFAAQGLANGARVAVTVHNGLAFLDAWFGGLYQGLTLLPVPPMSAPPELSFRLRHAACAALVLEEATCELGERALLTASATRPLRAETLNEGSEDHPGPVDLPPESAAMVLYTSGTTGTPKGAMISHASLFAHTAALVHHTLRLGRDDVVLACLPLTHSYGIRMTLLAPFFAGARVVLMRRFQVDPVLAVLAQEEVRWFPGVPTMFHALANADGATSRQNRLRSCLSAGAPLPRDVRLRAEAVLGTKVRQGYGLTEATFTSVATCDDDDDADGVGRPVFGVEVRISDAQGRALPPGHQGEVCVRGQNLMTGYLDDEQATRAVMRDGFLRSGDVGVLDAQGRLRIVDRIKDMVIRGGFNVYPAEVEAVLHEHPAIFDVVVVGVADAHYGEEVVAVVVPRSDVALDPAELSAFCRARLSATKLPRLLACVEALPVGPSGKVQRRVVRERVRAGELALTRIA